MSPILTLNIHVATDMTSRRLNAEVRITGDANELLIPTVESAILQQLDSEFRDHIVGIEWDDPDFPERLLALIPDGTTIGAAVEFFGKETDAQPATIRVTDGGYGGDGDVGYIFDLLNVAFTGAGYVATTLAVQRQVMKVRYAKYRRLAKDWNDSGVVSRELHEAIWAEPSWSRVDFDKTFGLDSSRGPELLRNCRFQRRDYDWGEHWERSPDDDGAFSDAH